MSKYTEDENLTTTAEPQFRIPDLKDVFQARNVVNRYLRPTPLLYSRRLSRELGCQAHLKLENLQPTRAFKVRGGVNYMNRKREQAMKHGVITASTGNHAQSIAYAGSLFGVKVTIVMPRGVPQLKIDGVKELEAEIITFGSYYDEAREYAEKIATTNGAVYVHGSNEPLLIEGVATMHLEAFEELPDVDVVINPIGGGSGASGACIVHKAMNSKVRVIGVQAEGAPAFYQSWKDGAIRHTDGVKTDAEGLATARGYELPLAILRKKLDDVILVNDEEMKNAIRSIFRTTGQIAELSGAASTAAAFKIAKQLHGKNVVLLVSGGNIESKKLVNILGTET
jgi:threonine dehydratase